MEKKSIEILFLSEPDMIEAGVLDAERCVEVMDECLALVGKGDYLMGGPSRDDHGLNLFYPQTSEFPTMPLAGPDHRYTAMPAYLGGRFASMGTKWYGSHSGNRAKGLPRSILMIGLNRADTGEPYAIMSANLLSAMRTGCVPGVATKYLARKDAENLCVVGCGVISHACAKGILSAMPYAKRLYLYDIFKDKAELFGEEFRQSHDIEIVVCDSLQEAVENGDVISIAASGATPVEIKDEWLRPGCLFTSTGQSRLTKECMLSCRIVYDHLNLNLQMYKGIKEMAEVQPTPILYASRFVPIRAMEAGEIEKVQLQSLTDIAAGRLPGRSSDEDRIIFLSQGLPTEDVAWGVECYETAVSKGLGQKLKLWDGAYWM